MCQDHAKFARSAAGRHAVSRPGVGNIQAADSHEPGGGLASSGRHSHKPGTHRMGDFLAVERNDHESVPGGYCRRLFSAVAGRLVRIAGENGGAAGKVRCQRPIVTAGGVIGARGERYLRLRGGKGRRRKDKVLRTFGRQVVLAPFRRHKAHGLRGGRCGR